MRIDFVFILTASNSFHSANKYEFTDSLHGIDVFKENPADTLRLKGEKRTQIATNMQYIIVH